MTQPTHEELILERERSDALGRLAEEEASRIRSAYIGSLDVSQTAEQEIFYRLRASASALSAKDAERDRLAGKAKALRTWIKSSSRTLAELTLFNAGDNKHWRKS